MCGDCSSDAQRLFDHPVLLLLLLLLLPTLNNFANYSELVYSARSDGMLENLAPGQFWMGIKVRWHISVSCI
jgi:hypothetical protein